MWCSAAMHFMCVCVWHVFGCGGMCISAKLYKSYFHHHSSAKCLCFCTFISSCRRTFHFRRFAPLLTPALLCDALESRVFFLVFTFREFRFLLFYITLTCSLVRSIAILSLVAIVFV